MREATNTAFRTAPGEELAAYLQVARATLLDRWRARVLTDRRIPSARELSERAHVDHLPVLLDRLEHSLARLGAGVPPEELGHGAWTAPAALDHAEERIDHGYAIDELTRELFHLRAAVLDEISAAGLEPDRAGRTVIDEVFAEAIAVAAGESARATEGREEAARDRVLGIVSHDLRNPLHAVRSGVEYLLTHGTLGPSERGVAERIRRSADSMTKMVGDLLDAVRVRIGGGLPVVPAPVDLRALIAECVEEQRAIDPARAVVISLDGALDGVWDAGRLAQALGNVLSNAIRYGDPDVAVQVRARGEEDRVVLEVWNAGPAIPADSLARVFEPFQRGARSGGDGAGLGLYIARAIAVAHGGALEVDSDAAHGTRVRCTLPRRPR